MLQAIFQLSTRRNCQIFGWNSTNISQCTYFGKGKEEEELLFTITNSTKSLEGSSGSAMLHLIENSDNERSRLHFSKRALSTCFRRPSDMRSLWDWGQHANLVGASCINIGSQNELMSPAKKGSLRSTIHFLWNTFWSFGSVAEILWFWLW